MKNIYRLLFTVIFLLQGYALSAQDYKTFQLGIKAGGNLYSTSLNVDDAIAKNVKPGFLVGLTAEYAFSESAYLQTGLDFFTKGAVLKRTETIDGGTMDWKQTFNMQYFQVPVMFAYKLLMVSDIQVYFHGGIYAAYGIGGKSSYNMKTKAVNGTEEEIKQDTFGDNGFKKFDYGIRFGSGVEFDKFLVGLDFEYGLANISQSSNQLSTLLDGRNYKNRGVTLSVGYKF